MRRRSEQPNHDRLDRRPSLRLSFGLLIVASIVAAACAPVAPSPTFPALCDPADPTAWCPDWQRTVPGVAGDVTTPYGSFIGASVTNHVDSTGHRFALVRSLGRHDAADVDPDTMDVFKVDDDGTWTRLSEATARYNPTNSTHLGDRNPWAAPVAVPADGSSTKFLVKDYWASSTTGQPDRQKIAILDTTTGVRTDLWTYFAGPLFYTADELVVDMTLSATGGHAAWNQPNFGYAPYTRTGRTLVWSQATGLTDDRTLPTTDVNGSALGFQPTAAPTMLAFATMLPITVLSGYVGPVTTVPFLSSLDLATGIVSAAERVTAANAVPMPGLSTSDGAVWPEIQFTVTADPPPSPRWIYRSASTRNVVTGAVRDLGYPVLPPELLAVPPGSPPVTPLDEYVGSRVRLVSDGSQLRLGLALRGGDPAWGWSIGDPSHPVTP